MLRALEAEIVRQTGAMTVEVPDYGLHAITKRIGHAMRWDPARRLMPKKSFPVEADVLWYVLMGPENYELDLFKDWNLNARKRIVYLFDTLEPQFELTGKLFSNDLFNIRIASFHDAVPFLESLSEKKWHAIEQGVPEGLFTPLPSEKRGIDFSSYGRKLPAFHEALLEFCHANGLYYDYTTHDVKHPTAPEAELYAQYAWHVSHSIFNISWPVELTNPKRAGRLYPVTCRWFEAASAATVILGRKPANELFDQLLYPELVVEIDPAANKQSIWKNLEKIYAARTDLLDKAADIQQSNAGRWTWGRRVSAMLELPAR